MEGETEMYNHTNFQHFHPLFSLLISERWLLFEPPSQSSPSREFQNSVNMAAGPTHDLYLHTYNQVLIFRSQRLCPDNLPSVLFPLRPRLCSALFGSERAGTSVMPEEAQNASCQAPPAGCNTHNPLLLDSIAPTIHSGLVLKAPDKPPSNCPYLGGTCLVSGSWPLCV